MNSVKKASVWLATLLTLVTAMLCANQDIQQQPCCPSKTGFFARSDVLYWTPRVTGLDLNFGTTQIVEDLIGCTQILKSKEVNIDPHFNWDVGYRVGGGYECSQWKAELLWTHFNGNGTRSSHQDLNIHNHGKIKIKLDQIDLALTYNYAVSCSFILQPFIGIRATRLHEHIHALSSTKISRFPTSKVIETRTINDRQKYWGVGPLLGVQGDWDIGCGFGFYGAAAAGLLYGDYEVHLDNKDTFSTPISKQIVSVNRRHLHAFDYNIDLALGISWQTLICNLYELRMKLGVEQHQYFNQNRLCAGREDISFTGGVFSFDLGF